MSTFYEIRTKHINTLVGENVDSLDFELDGTYSYHGSLTVYNIITPRPYWLSSLFCIWDLPIGDSRVSPTVVKRVMFLPSLSTQVFPSTPSLWKLQMSCYFDTEARGVEKSLMREQFCVENFLKDKFQSKRLGEGEVVIFYLNIQRIFWSHLVDTKSGQSFQFVQWQNSSVFNCKVIHLRCVIQPVCIFSSIHWYTALQDRFLVRWFLLAINHQQASFLKNLHSPFITVSFIISYIFAVINVNWRFFFR